MFGMAGWLTLASVRILFPLCLSCITDMNISASPSFSLYLSSMMAKINSDAPRTSYGCSAWPILVCLVWHWQKWPTKCRLCLCL